MSKKKRILNKEDQIVKELFDKKIRMRYLTFIDTYWDDIKDKYNQQYWIVKKCEELGIEKFRMVSFYKALQQFKKRAKDKSNKKAIISERISTIIEEKKEEQEEKKWSDPDELKKQENRDKWKQNYIKMTDKILTPKKTKMKKEFNKIEKTDLHFVIQSKGGVGKSFLTALMAHKAVAINKKCLFIDVDESTKTSSNQLKFLKDYKVANNINSIQEIKLKNQNGYIISDRLYKELKSIYELKEKDEELKAIILDFGSAESEALLYLLLESPLTIDETLDLINNEFNFNLIFDIVIEGGNSYHQSMTYLNKILNIVKDKIQVNIYINHHSFEKNLLADIKKYYDSKKEYINAQLLLFGGRDLISDSTKDIKTMFENGQDIKTLPISTQWVLKAFYKEVQI